jgi:TPR repeat protein
MHVSLTALLVFVAFCVLVVLVLLAFSKTVYTRQYLKAAESGLVQAQASLGMKYAAGFNVSQDYVQAHKWLTIAAERASGLDQSRYASARDLVAKEMDASQVAEARNLAREWMQAFEQKKQKSRE